jgi:hypothetical protein
MPTIQSLATVAQMHLVQTVDTARVAGDNFKLPALLRTQLNTDQVALESADSNTVLTESDRAGGSAAARVALDNLEDLLGEGHKFIGAIRKSAITDAQRLEAFTAYGWASGNVGEFNDGRVIGLSRLALLAHANLPAAHHYTADLLADITAQLAVFDGNVGDATGGDREAATNARDEKLEAAKTTLSQVRYYYCSASRDLDQTPELAKINFQPKRDRGTVDKNEEATPVVPPQ